MSQRERDRLKNLHEAAASGLITQKQTAPELQLCVSGRSGGWYASEDLAREIKVGPVAYVGLLPHRPNVRDRQSSASVKTGLAQSLEVLIACGRS